MQVNDLEKALDAAKTFDMQKKLGNILLLPSDIEPRVLLRFKKRSLFWDGDSLHFSVVCILKPQERVIYVADQREVLNTQDHIHVIENISSPSLLFTFDWSYKYVLDPIADYYQPQGYFFKYEKGETLNDILATAKHYFFPHIYHDAHLCIPSVYSPRHLNTAFWTSNFHNNWEGLYADIREYELGDDRQLFKDSYQEYQKSSSPLLDEEHQKFLESYTDFFELNEKPIGIFVSADNSFIARIAINNWLTCTFNYYDNEQKEVSVLLGFVFLKDGFYWVWLKDGSFLKLTAEQVKVV